MSFFSIIFCSILSIKYSNVVIILFFVLLIINSISNIKISSNILNLLSIDDILKEIKGFLILNITNIYTYVSY